MKMARVCGVAVFLLCCVVSKVSLSKGSSSGCDLHAAAGANFDVPLGRALQPDETLKWKRNDDVIFVKKPLKVAKGKDDDVNKDGGLRLINVRKDQEGLYTCEVFNKEGISQLSKTARLCVHVPVTKPTLKFECKEQNVEFTCNYKNTENTELKWLQDEVETEWTKMPLKLIAERSKGVKISCRISNQVSNKSSDTLTHDCIKSVIPGFPEELFGISIWIFVGGGGGIVLLLIIVVIICCIRSKRRRGMRLKDEEELRLDWTNNQQQNHHHHLPPLPNQHPNHHHHHHQHHQQQQHQAGNTGPRQSRSKQQRNQRPKAPEPSEGQPQPQPQPRRYTQAPKAANDGNDDQPPPLPQPRKKAP